MKRLWLLALVVAPVLGAGPVVAQGPVVAKALAPAVVAQNPDAALAGFFEAIDAAELERSPESRAYRGIRTGQNRWDDRSDAAEAAANAADIKALAEMRARFAGAALSPESKVSYRLFERTMEQRIAAYGFRDNGLVFDHMDGLHSAYPAFLINIHRVASKADAQDYVARLQALGPALEADIARSEARAARGVMPPKWVFPLVLSDARNTISGAPFDASGVDSPLLADFTAKLEKLDLPAAEKLVLHAAATAALKASVQPAYARLIATLEAQQARAGTEDGLWRLPNGAADYARRLAGYTSTSMSAEDIHALGLAQVQRIHGEMLAVARQTGFAGELPAFFAQMRSDARFFLPEGEAGKAEYLKRANGFLADIAPKLPQYFRDLPKSALVVQAVEPFREATAGKAFYTSPATDGSRPGIVYVNLYRLADMPTTEMEALIYHEGVPGHHFERASATALKGLPPFRRYGGYTAYTEGWGLYAEALAKDMGQYRDPYSDFGRLQMELHRAIRLVVDTGIHHKRWSREQAIAWTLANSAESEGAVAKAIERYVVLPGQATAYMIGRLKISELRSRAEAALGDKFDIRDFHAVVLRSGPVPLDVLETNVDAWIAEVYGA